MKPVVVDGSWLVIIRCFLVITIMDGLHDSFGIIVPELITRRNYNRQSVAWISITLEATWKFTACIASGLCRMYGCRFPVILGGIIICTGYIGTAFAYLKTWYLLPY